MPSDTSRRTLELFSSTEQATRLGLACCWLLVAGAGAQRWALLRAKARKALRLAAFLPSCGEADLDLDREADLDLVRFDEGENDADVAHRVTAAETPRLSDCGEGRPSVSEMADSAAHICSMESAALSCYPRTAATLPCKNSRCAQ